MMTIRVKGNIFAKSHTEKTARNITAQTHACNS